MQVENAEFTVISKWDKVGGDGIFWFVEDAIREILHWSSLLFAICMGVRMNAVFGSSQS